MGSTKRARKDLENDTKSGGEAPNIPKVQIEMLLPQNKTLTQHHGGLETALTRE